MRDAQLKFGKNAAATKATRVYSADVLDMGAASNLGNVDDLFACFQLEKAVTSGDSFKFEVYDSDDNSTFALIVDSGTAITSGAAGDVFTVPLPKAVRRYIKTAVYPDSTGTLTAQDITSWLEFR